MENQFGQYITTKRKALGINLRKFAQLVDNMAPAYLSDIEKGNRYPPDKDKIQKMAQILQLTSQETAYLYDLAAFDRASVEKEKSSAVPPDLPEYIMSNENLRIALRTARDASVTNNDWHKVIELFKDKNKQPI
jgi:transcriptional regulator with XRE-family HTH domain